jgi:uncharacterized repeat protein (TIGR03803 family)
MKTATRNPKRTDDVRPRATYMTEWWRSFGILCLALVATAIASPAQEHKLSAPAFTTLDSFDNTDGAAPAASLLQATDGNLYGTANDGGANGGGTVFRLTPDGKLTSFYSFCSQSDCTDGQYPVAALIQAADGNFYGTTLAGGTYGNGTVFTITPSGALTTLHSFDATDGANPTAALVQATDGNFYGTTSTSGTSGYGTVFKITPSGALTTLHSFNSVDGANPWATLIQAIDGNLYGTTSGCGPAGSHSCASEGYGTIFKITPSGTLTTLYSFCSQTDCLDGANPYAGLVQASDGNLYGTTAFYGADGRGTIFKITPSGSLSTLHSFCSESNCKDGANPESALIQATDGSFYGTTVFGGADEGGDCLQCGTIFRITSGGTLTSLYSFCLEGGCPDGSNPYAALVQDTNGNFYGTAGQGGANFDGTVFSLSVGLGIFVSLQPASGKVGATIRILGTDLAGTTSVSFNGTPAAFKVVSHSLISATVPESATTGFVTVTTPSGTLKSNVRFRVRP